MSKIQNFRNSYMINDFHEEIKAVTNLLFLELLFLETFYQSQSLEQVEQQMSHDITTLFIDTIIL